MAFTRADLGVTAVAVKVHTVRRGMVKHAIQDDVHAPVMRLLRQGDESLQVAKIFGNKAVIGRVIFVVGGRFKDGVEVDGGHTQILQVIQLINHPLQIAAVEVSAVAARAGVACVTRVADHLVPGVARATRRVRTHNGAAGFVVEETAGRGVVTRITVAETVGENLVDDGVFHPVGRLESGVVLGDLPAIVRAGGKRLAPAAIAGGVVFVVGGGGAVNGDEPVPVEGGVEAGGQGRFPPFIRAVVGGQVHVQEGLGVGAVVVEADASGRQVIAGSAQPQGDGRARMHRPPRRAE